MIKITVASHTIKKTAHKEVADLVVKVNDILYYEYESFDSVGMHAEYHISDLSVLIIYQEKTKYHYPERLIKGMPGADSIGQGGPGATLSANAAFSAGDLHNLPNHQ